MRHPTFLEGVAVAVVASTAGSILFTALTAVFAGGAVLRVVIAGIGLGYVLYLFSRSRERTGRITALVAWAAVAGLTWLMSPALPLYALVHLGLVWLIRSLYFYCSVLSALADLGLTGLSLAAAVWASIHTGSLFLAIWCLFLVQALFVAIPEGMDRKGLQGARSNADEDRFQRAYRAAQAAVRKLASER
jgi:hypothetical protein